MTFYKPKLDDWELHVVLRALLLEADALLEVHNDREGYKEVHALHGRLFSMMRLDVDDMERVTAKAEQSISEWQARAAEERAKLYEGADPVLVGAER